MYRAAALLIALAAVTAGCAGLTDRTPPSPAHTVAPHIENAYDASDDAILALRLPGRTGEPERITCCVGTDWRSYGWELVHTTDPDGEPVQNWAARHHLLADIPDCDPISEACSYRKDQGDTTITVETEPAPVGEAVTLTITALTHIGDNDGDADDDE